MKHKQSGRSLGREANHRRALMRGLSSSLLEHRSIVTTTAKAKELQRYIEPLITKAKAELTLPLRRRLLRDLAAADITRLLAVAQLHKNRPGGYTRVTALPRTRHDNAPTMRIDIITNE